MAGDNDDSATVLIVDDERKLVDMYQLWLRDDYDVRTAYDGQGALAAVGEGVDVVVLDRRMPGLSGDDVLERIHDEYDCHVIVMTAVDPDFDIVRMPFDDYLCKPVQHDDLVDAIDLQLLAREHGDSLREYLMLTSTLKMLKMEKTSQELQHSAEFARLQTRAERLKDDIRDTVPDFDGVLSAFQGINRRP